MRKTENIYSIDDQIRYNITLYAWLHVLGRNKSVVKMHDFLVYSNDDQYVKLNIDTSIR